MKKKRRRAAFNIPEEAMMDVGHWDEEIAEDETKGGPGKEW